ncbi:MULTISPECIES: hypothetical protein [unclassified Paenibacillus]|uniref:hypothetical protein n=2 Tax=Paenibacillus TaxID=44249 RepID=UPI0030F65EA1
MSIALAKCYRSPLDLLQLLLTLSWMRSSAQDQIPPANRSRVFSSSPKCLQVPDLSIALAKMLQLTAGSPAAAAHALLDAASYRQRIDPESSAAHLSVFRFRMSIALAKCYRSPLDLLQLLLTLSWMRSSAQDQIPPANRSRVFSSSPKCLQVPDEHCPG